MNNVWAIIPNRIEKKHQSWLLKKCLESLFDFEPSMQDRTIVVDDVSPLFDCVIDITTKFRIKLVKATKKSSYSQLINFGLKAARGVGASGLITINNDIEHKSKFLDIISEIVVKDPKISIIGPLLFYPDGRTQHSGVEVTNQGGAWCEDHYRGKLREWSKPRYCHHTTGAWQFIKMEGMTRDYDVKFPMTFEDVDFCLRLWENDERTYFTDKIHHIHHESVTRGRQVTHKEIESAKQFKESVYNLELINTYIKQANHHMESS